MRGLKQAITSDSRQKPEVRGLAAEILTKVDTRRAYADILLDHSLKAAGGSPRDRALLTELTYGTLRWRGRIDGYLIRQLHRPLSQTDPFIRNLLRVTFYQLIFLNRIPEYAAVNEAVGLAKTRGGQKAADFVNGVLRNFLREKIRPPEPSNALTSALAEYWSHPEWLVKKWFEYLGTEETKPLLKTMNQAAPLVLRANVLEGSRDALLKLLQRNGIRASPTQWSPQGITIAPASAISRLPGFEEGLFQVQGEAAQLVSYLLSPEPGERILDACAAPGGKATHLAELIADDGNIVALDISARGLKRIKENVTRLGLKSIRTFRADASQQLPRSLSLSYDRVLVDAPCSGFGTLRSHPEIKWHRTEEDIERLGGLQRKIIERVSAYLKPAGILVYSTCTLTREENEKVIEEFLVRHGEFVLEDAARSLPDEARHLVKGKYFWTLPHRYNTDGFFAARLRKAA